MATQLTVRSPFLDNDLVQTVFRSPASCWQPRRVPAVDRRWESGPERYSHGQGCRVEGGGVLAEASLEFSFKLSTMRTATACRSGSPALTTCCRRFRFDRLFLGRHKYAHFRVWYRDSLSKHVQEILLDQRTLQRSFIDRNTVERIVAKHVTGVGNYTFEIHRLLS